MAKQLDCRAELSAYEREADDLFAALQAGENDARWRFKWQHPRYRDQPVSAVDAGALNLDDARLVVAHDYSFETWAELKAFTDAVRAGGPVALFESAVEALVTGDEDALAAMLRQHPELVRARSTRRHHATLLHYVGANGVEGGRQRTPPNAVAMAGMLLEAGAEVDALADMYDQKCTTMSMLVSSCHPANAGLQIPLVETLLDHGAQLVGPGTNWQSAVLTALVFGYPETAVSLARRGPKTENLVESAGLGDTASTARLLPTAGSETRHKALALAAQLGQASVVRLLLDAGEDPNRFNPEGFHSHSTPLHQAALVGHSDVVRLLVERGARLDIRDKLFDGTPLGWAEHGKQTAVAEYLRTLTTE